MCQKVSKILILQQAQHNSRLYEQYTAQNIAVQFLSVNSPLNHHSLRFSPLAENPCFINPSHLRLLFPQDCLHGPVPGPNLLCSMVFTLVLFVVFFGFFFSVSVPCSRLSSLPVPTSFWDLGECTCIMSYCITS